MESNTHCPLPSAAAEAISALCKGLIISAHGAGAAGIAEGEAFLAFSAQGASFAQFNAFVGNMVRAGLLERHADFRLRPTPRGLAYAGIDARGRTPVAIAA